MDKFSKLLDAARIILHVTENHTILPLITIELIQTKFTAAYSNSSVRK